MTSGGDTGERNDIPELATAVEELRTLLRAFDVVRPADMDERFFIHAFNELDLAGRTIIEAFDRDRAARSGVVAVPGRPRRLTLRVAISEYR